MMASKEEAKPTPVRILRGPFAGAKMLLRRRISKRKILGLYEHVLNGWLTEKISRHSTYFDIGANNGYHTYGFAHAAIAAGHRDVRVVALDPVVTPELTEPRCWPAYRNCSIEIVEKYVAAKAGDDAVTLTDLLRGTSSCLVKMDIEGAEATVLPEAAELLENSAIDWCIEIHGDELIPQIASLFCNAGRGFLLRELTPLLFLGPEHRPIHTTWLTTI